MENSKIMCRNLDGALFISKLVSGVDFCGNEKYLRELVNASEYFLSLSDNENYHGPESESNGECDCISKNYQLDFKLFASQSLIKAKSKLDNNYTVHETGAIIDCGSVSNGTEEVSVIWMILEDFSDEDLEAIGNGTFSNTDNKYKNLALTDVRNHLKILKTKKNLFLYLPIEFIVYEETSFDEAVKLITARRERNFSKSIRYRLKHSPGYDTYLAFLFREHLIILKECNGRFNYIDKVPLEKSPSFNKLKDIVF